MAYDEELAERIRELVAGEPDLTEKKMFGGLAFLIGGNMAVAASGQGGVLVRVDPAESDMLVSTTNARLMEMRGREMQGWLRIDLEEIRTKPAAGQMGRARYYLRSLAPGKALAGVNEATNPSRTAVQNRDRSPGRGGDQLEVA